MQHPTYSFQRGEPIIIGRQIISGDPTGFTARASLKPARGSRLPDQSVLAVATFESDFVTATATTPAHFLLWITAVNARNIEPGLYVTDVRFELGGETVEITDPAWIEIRKSVSG